MSKLHTVPKICRVKSQSPDYLAYEVPMNLRGWVAVVESPHWFAWPIGPTTKTSSAAQQQECTFLEASLKKGKGVFLQRGVFIWQARNFFVKARDFFQHQGEKIAIKRVLCVQTLANRLKFKNHGGKLSDIGNNKCNPISRQWSSPLTFIYIETVYNRNVL